MVGLTDNLGAIPIGRLLRQSEAVSLDFEEGNETALECVGEAAVIPNV